jgi:hypothetical protein
MSLTVVRKEYCSCAKKKCSCGKVHLVNTRLNTLEHRLLKHALWQQDESRLLPSEKRAFRRGCDYISKSDNSEPLVWCLAKGEVQAEV